MTKYPWQTFKAELSDLISELPSNRFWGDIPLIRNKEEFKKAIGELVCRHLGRCEPYEGLTEELQHVTGCCKFCGNREC